MMQRYKKVNNWPNKRLIFFTIILKLFAEYIKLDYFCSKI